MTPSFDTDYPSPHALEAAGLTIEQRPVPRVWVVRQNGTVLQVFRTKGAARAWAEEYALDLLEQGLIGACEEDRT